jgi:hypothetical protein
MTDQAQAGIRFLGGSRAPYHVARDLRDAIPEEDELNDEHPTVLAIVILSAVAVEGFLNKFGDELWIDPGGAPLRPGRQAARRAWVQRCRSRHIDRHGE